MHSLLHFLVPSPVCSGFYSSFDGSHNRLKDQHSHSLCSSFQTSHTQSTFTLCPDIALKKFQCMCNFFLEKSEESSQSQDVAAIPEDHIFHFHPRKSSIHLSPQYHLQMFRVSSMPSLNKELRTHCYPNIWPGWPLRVPWMSRSLRWSPSARHFPLKIRN